MFAVRPLSQVPLKEKIKIYAAVVQESGEMVSRYASNSSFSPFICTVRTLARSRLNTPRMDFASIVKRL
mgnify:CR=1 FL=1